MTMFTRIRYYRGRVPEYRWRGLRWPGYDGMYPTWDLDPWKGGASMAGWTYE